MAPFERRLDPRFGRGGGGGGQMSLQDMLQGVQNPNFAAFQDPLTDMARSVTEQLFGAGGAVEQASGQALRSSVQSGFGPSSGGFDSARMNILQGASDQAASAIGQGAMQLAPLALQQAESLFGGQATIENLGLARRQLDMNERILNESLQRSECSIGDRIGGGLSGALGGAIGAGSLPEAALKGLGSFATGGLATLAGGVIGGLGGLFGGC